MPNYLKLPTRTNGLIRVVIETPRGAAAMLIERFGTDYEMVGERRISASLKCDRCGRKGAVIHSLANTMPNGYAKAKDDRSDC